ncbi:MAG: Uma2 family endonuclease [Bryobacteraceae bacterium]|nr:Uma2 family endonuclease [Bryobacteraceae bacterium]
MGAAPHLKLSVDEYLAFDREAELKSEYHDGALFPLAAVSFAHSCIAAGITTALRTRLRGTGCRAAISPLRVRVSASKFVYPDIVVVCNQPTFTDEQVDTLNDARSIVEVLSPSTQDYDYGGKFELYRRLPEFSEYLLVSQSEARVDIFRKQSETSWTLDIVTGLDASVQFAGVTIPLAEVYEDVTFHV